jgi:Family of unknown function (DUF5670)
MKDLLYLIIIILVIGWIFGAFVFHVGGVIHIVLVLAVVLLLFKLIDNRRI